MREKFREMGQPGVECPPYSSKENAINCCLKKERFFEKHNVYGMLNPEVEILLEEVINNKNARLFFGVKKDRDFEMKYYSLINELQVRGIEYIQ